MQEMQIAKGIDQSTTKKPPGFFWKSFTSGIFLLFEKG